MKRNDEYLKKAIRRSIVLHILIVGLLFLGRFNFQRNADVVMDVEIAGEGELREESIGVSRGPAEDESMPENNDDPGPEIPLNVAQSLPENPEVEQPISVEKEIPVEETVSKEITESIPEPENAVPELVEVPEEKVTEQEEVKQEEIKEEQKIDTNEEAIPRDQSEDKKRELEEKKKRKDAETKKQEEKAKIKKKKIALTELIKKADRQQKKKDRKRKIAQLLASKKAAEAKKLAAKKKNTDFMKMLEETEKSIKDVKAFSNTNKGRGNSSGLYGSGTGRKGNGAGSEGSGLGITGNDGDIISSQIYKHWVVPARVKDAENLNVDLHIELEDTGAVIPSGVTVIDKARYASDSLFRAAADSARRAILAASPLKIPPDKIEVFRSCKVRFNVKEALGE